MTYKISKRFVARKILPRLVIAFCLFVGLAAVWIWQPLMQQTSTRFLVQIPKTSEPRKQETIIQNRDLSDYDLGVSFSGCPFVDDEEFQQCNNAENKGREFIWNHWKTKRSGYIVYIAAAGSRDAAYQVHIFIEPDEKGMRHIVQRWKKPNHYAGIDDYYEVESNDSTFIKKAKTNDGKVGKDRFYLIFLDENKKEIDTL